MTSQTPIDRRTALTSIAVGAGALGLASCAKARPGAAALAAPLLSSTELGYDARTNEYTLPPLPYAYDALEPAIDEQTMRIHHDKHHAGYIRGLNRALAKLSEIREGTGDAGLIKHWSRELSFHGSGHVNHALFWLTMATAGNGGGGAPSGALAEAIDASFGSFEKFKTHFSAASGAVEGSGWGWLVHEPTSGRLLVIQGEKQQDMMMTGVTPLLGLDVWEHAYYLKYQNRRADYVKSWWSVVNWSKVAQLYTRANG